MVKTILDDVRSKMEKAITALHGDFNKIRTGRASVNILDDVRVDSYGSSVPLNQVASLSVPESRTILIQPWDASQISTIEKAILNSDLGLTPGNDGKVIRINIPAPTEERRREFVKTAKRYAEESRVSIRNTRRDGNEELKSLEKEKEISQDDLKKAQQDVQAITDEMIKKVDDHLATKEVDIMEV